jgi:prepilin-type N-terminal cleavage/methylation domain-containing protein
MKMFLEKSIFKLKGQNGFTLIEIIVASLILTLIVAAVVKYHTSVGVTKGQQYYLKAVQTARNELEKLRALYELKSGVSEFYSTGSPPNKIFLFKFVNKNAITTPSPIFRVYYDDSGVTEFLKSIGAVNSVKSYRQYYKNNYVTDTDKIDGKTFTYLTDDNNTITNTDGANGKVDASIVIIDDMGSPLDLQDDLIGNIGWWVTNVPEGEPNSTAMCKKITFALQFWYPGQDWTEFDPEVVVLKTTMVKP